MSKEYKHGAYGVVAERAPRAVTTSPSAPVYVGTAPTHTVSGGAANLNKPVLIRSFDEAARLFGYSDNWADYTLCEAVYAHFVAIGAAPIILINVFDVAAHKAATQASKSVMPSKGRAVIAEAWDAVLDSVEITGKEAGIDFAVSFDYETGVLTIEELADGALGTAALTVTYDTVEPSGVTAAEVIGTTDGEGTNTGLFAVANVYPLTGVVPCLLLAPGFSDTKEVRDAMAFISARVNGHWDMIIYTDIPLAGASGRMTLAAAAKWKADNGYTAENEKVFFPIGEDADGRKYHLSVLAAAVRQMLDAESGGRPYRSPSNNPIPIVKLYLGADANHIVLDDKIINDKLCINGITSAAFIGGRWVIWGAHAAAYDQQNADSSNVADTNRAMLYYITNDFQIRRGAEVDKPMTRARLSQIRVEEQARLDALIAGGMMVHAEVSVKTDEQAVQDMIMGDFTFIFTVTTVPLAKSLTAYVTPSDEGLATYYMEV